MSRLYYKIFLILRNALYFINSLLIILSNKLFSKYYKSYNKIDCNVDITSKDIICLFSHYSSDGKIADYVLSYVKSLYNCGCAIVFVSTCAKIDRVSLENIKPYISTFVTRPNKGRDFGSFVCGYELIKNYNHYNYLIFTNDSVYGPLHSLTPIFDLIKKEDCDVAGFTDSWQRAYHLQSYFLIFSKKVFTSKAFTEFIANFKFSNSKTYIILEYEIGMSATLVKNGFSLKAVCNYFDVAKTFYETHQKVETIKYKNPTHHFWKTLIQDYNYPFLKRELVLVNPAKIVDLYLWKSVVEETNYDPCLIKEHLKQFSQSR